VLIRTLPDRVLNFIKSNCHKATLSDIATVTGLTPAEIRRFVAKERARLRETQGIDSQKSPKMALPEVQAAFEGKPVEIFSKFFVKKVGRVVWSQSEKDFLEMNIGQKSIQEIADQLGRTKDAVQKMAERMGLDFKDTGLFYTLSDVCQVTGLGEGTILRHIRTGRLQHTQHSGYRIKEHIFVMAKARHKLYDKFKTTRVIKSQNVMSCFRNSGYRTRLFEESAIRLFMQCHAKSHKTQCIFCGTKVTGDILCDVCSCN
jgi:hypothetical protein